MLAKTTLTSLMATTLIVIGSPTSYAKDTNPLSISLEAGGGYDSNITVDSKDLNSAIGDRQAQFQGDIGYQLKNDKKFKLNVGYSFYQTLYKNQTAFNLQIHGLSIGASTQVGKVTVGGSYRYNYILLGRQNFLDMHSVGPSVSFQAGKNIFVTLSYEYQRQNFKQATLKGRDANRNSFNSMIFYPLGHGRSLIFSYKLMRHTTQDTVLSYWGNVFSAGVKLPFNVAESVVTFRGRYRFRKKSFLNFNPAIGAKRSDKRHSVRASLEMPLFNKVTAKLQYKYIDSISNLASINYKEQIVTLMFIWKL